MTARAAKQAPAWSVTVAVTDIPQAGLHRTLEADAASRRAAAELANLRDVAQLTATFDLEHTAGGGVRVTGQVRAIVGQNCVVTLEPVENTIEEAVDVTFAPPNDSPETAGKIDAETDVTAPDPPEPLINGMIDLGQLATEFMILGIDPYPRRPDASFAPVETKEDPAMHPFAALAALKKSAKPGGEGGAK